MAQQWVLSPEAMKIRLVNTSRIEAFKRSLESESREAFSLRQHVDLLRRELERQKREGQNALEKLVTEHQSEIAALRSENDRLASRLGSLSPPDRDGKRALLQREFLELKELLQVKEQENAELKQKLLEAEAEFSERNASAKARAMDIDVKLSNAEVEVETLKEQLRSTKEMLDAKRATIKELQKKINETEVNNRDHLMRDRNIELKKRRELEKQVMDQRLSFAAERHSLILERDKLISRIKDIENTQRFKHENIDLEQAKVKEYINTLESDLAKERKKHHEYIITSEEKLAEAEAKCLDLEKKALEQTTTFSEKINLLALQSNEHELQRKFCEQKLDNLQTDLAKETSARQKSEEMATKAELLNQQLEHKAEEITRLTKMFESLKSDYGELRSLMNEAATVRQTDAVPSVKSPVAESAIQRVVDTIQATNTAINATRSTEDESDKGDIMRRINDFERKHEEFESLLKFAEHEFLNST